MRNPFALHGLAEGFRAELRNGDLTSSESRRSEHERKVGDVKYWRRMKIDTAFSVMHPVVDVVQISQNVGMSECHTFGPARSSAGIDECEYSVRVVNIRRKGVFPKVEWFFVDDQLARKRNAWSSQRRMPNQPMRSCVNQYMIDLVLRQPGIQWHCNYAKPCARVHQLDILTFVRQ